MTDPQSVPPAYSPTPATQPKGLSIAALILGIASVPFGFLGVLGIILGILGVVFGFIARRRQPYARGMWLTGLILGFVGIVLGIIFITLTAIAVGAALQNSNQ